MLIPIEQVESKRVYLRLANGTIFSKKGDNQINYGAVQGSLESIELKTHKVDNKEFQNWHVILRDRLAGETYDLSVSKSSGAFKGIARSLVTEEGLANLDDIRIEAYLSKGGYTNAAVYANEKRLNWSDEKMPELVHVKVGDKDIIDDTAQVNWIQTLVDRINAKILSNARAKSRDDEGVELVGVEEVDDIPFEE